MDNIRMDKLEWIDVILVALFPFSGVVLYLVYKSQEEDERAEASLWAMILVLLIYIPLSFLLGGFGLFIGFLLLLCMYHFGPQRAQQRLGGEYGAVRPITDIASKSPPEGTARSDDTADIPSSCPNCGASLKPQEVERTWDGTVRCPYCEHTMEVS